MTLRGNITAGRYTTTSNIFILYFFLQLSTLLIHKLYSDDVFYHSLYFLRTRTVMSRLDKPSTHRLKEAGRYDWDSWIPENAITLSYKGSESTLENFIASNVEPNKQRKILNKLNEPFDELLGLTKKKEEAVPLSEQEEEQRRCEGNRFTGTRTAIMSDSRTSDDEIVLSYKKSVDLPLDDFVERLLRAEDRGPFAEEIKPLLAKGEEMMKSWKEQDPQTTEEEEATPGGDFQILLSKRNSERLPLERFARRFIGPDNRQKFIEQMRPVLDKGNGLVKKLEKATNESYASGMLSNLKSRLIGWV